MGVKIMTAPAPGPQDPAQQSEPQATEPQLDVVRRRRSELRAAMADLEAAMATPAGPDPAGWLQGVRDRVEKLRTALDRHVGVHEGPDSFHADVVRHQPHLAARVQWLQRDHTRLSDALGSVERELDSATPADESMDQVRALGTDVLHLFVRHRQRGADVVWEAFNYDVGGET